MKDNKRDLNILIFLWKYKVASSAILHEKFLSNMKYKSRYEKLRRLKKKNLISIRYNSNGTFPLWVLTKKGFDCIKSYIPELEKKYLISECRRHDFICLATQQGPFINEYPKDIFVTTDQEIKSLDRSQLPSYLPTHDTRRPDGYWYFNNGTNIKLMALEVELNQKSKSIYESYSHFYGKFKKDQRCLWIVKSEKIVDSILESFYKSRPEYYVHNFIFLDDILTKGWASSIYAGPERNKTLSSLFIENSEEVARNFGGVVHNPLLLDTTLSYGF